MSSSIQDLLIASGLGATIGFLGQLLATVFSGRAAKAADKRADRAYFRDRRLTDTREALDVVLSLHSSMPDDLTAVPSFEDPIRFEIAALLTFDARSREAMLVLSQLVSESQEFVREGIVLSMQEMRSKIDELCLDVVEMLAAVLRGELPQGDQQSVNSARHLIEQLGGLKRA